MSAEGKSHRMNWTSVDSSDMSTERLDLLSALTFADHSSFFYLDHPPLQPYPITANKLSHIAFASLYNTEIASGVTYDLHSSHWCANILLLFVHGELQNNLGPCLRAFALIHHLGLLQSTTLLPFTCILSLAVDICPIP
jgi:hypothetical protein